MAGGKWQAQNKIRPGAYINFKAVGKSMSAFGTRGVMTMPVTMSWGPHDKVIELLATDLIDGKCLEKIGHTMIEDESQIYREALKNCYKALIYRIDTGGEKAIATVEPLTITARYAGVIGNHIAVIVTKDTIKSSNYEVITLFRGIEKDRQKVTTIEDLKSNDWVDFSGTGVPVVTAGVPLANGTDGTIANDNFTAYLTAIKNYKFNTMAIPNENSTIIPLVISFIKNMRENVGRKVQAVLYNYELANYEGIITTSQGYKTKDEVISPVNFVAFIAGLTAGSAVDESNTYKVIDGATEVVGILSDGETEKALLEGKLILSSRQDGAIIIEQDINTLHEFTAEKDYAFSKNRVIRVLDEINNTISLTFAKSYIGKVDNDESGRTLFKADVISYLNMLLSIGAIQNFDSGSDIKVSAGQAIDAVVIDLSVKPVDSMEKLYMTVLVG